ncbi:C4-dicarboxylate ABC transporter substrate-binding protein [Roseobacter sp. HKCCD9010]|uniref:TRAP transporter substrate-binding protein DctP n=1 Tax=unclassified Roseobacter TaxID=196798 RepID=UPI0014915CBE|nr:MULTISPECIES: TRAP transporter substrate-binding protein DctP [unclassified Roseobacter]MBF9052368.1 C4-dicarboxylate ABC transporter substrate-binding protein [Rhodobacterales bacterium HKCCD4356]NNV14355.1 C4-dicarboxylate ABC transporter substrate-binding protein [Roseobacter sp. HKCCD7357]NNV18534.1 C4-dicarboxylate ABC transporter substrate-binding protein [Roseobacter sp. HKCCD8768]NNV27985.1 C4-dicarboxylate ABC transporter substrate-binding protein [Roseobacter sp. HKCCD8192]NNV3228
MTTRRKVLARIGTVTLAAPAIVTLGAVKVRAQEQAVEWRMQALWGGGTTPQRFEERFCTRVGELTGGSLTITPFAGGQIVPAAQAFDAVRGGAFQMMKTFDGYTAGRIPAHGFTSTVPFGFPESDQYEAWFYERGGLDMARESYAQAGLTYVAPTVYGEEPIHSRVEIRRIADMSGLKGRFVGLAAAVMGDFGVAVSPLSTGEVYSALDSGLVDFADRGDLQANYEEGLHEVAPYIILPGIHQPTTATSYVANTVAWQALSDSQRAAIEVAAREISGSLRQHILVANGEYLARFEDAGVETIMLDPEDIAEARAAARESWRNATNSDALATRILDSQEELLTDLRLL